MKKKLLKRLFIGCSALALIFVALVGVAIRNIGMRIDHKTVLEHREGLVEMRRELAAITPEKQWESDTCGLHTLRTIYRAYGLDPDGENLRARLGLDVPSNPLDATTTGTVQPDMLRVLVQDGFQYECPGNMVSIRTHWDAIFQRGDGAGSIDVEHLVRHLKSGNMAAVLTRRPQTGGMHWVAAYKLIGEQIEIVDSLADEPYRVDPQIFWDRQILSFILVQPGGRLPSPELVDHALVHGTRDMAFSAHRLKALQTR